MGATFFLTDGKEHHVLCVKDANARVVGDKSFAIEPGRFHDVSLRAAYDLRVDVAVDGEVVSKDVSISKGEERIIGSFGFAVSDADANEFSLSLIVSPVEKKKYVVRRASDVGAARRFVAPVDFSRPLSEVTKTAGAARTYAVRMLRIHLVGQKFIGAI